MLRSRLQALLARFAVDHLRHLGLGLDDRRAFDAYARMLTARNLRGALLAIIAATAACWALDRVVFGDVPDVVPRLAWVRALHIFSSAACYVLLTRTGLGRRPLVPGYLAAVFESGLLGVLAGLLGDLETPWFHCTYAIIFTSVLAVVPLAARVAFSAAIPTSLLAGYALARPLHAGQPMLLPTLAFLAFVTFVSILLGHGAYLLVEHDFVETRRERRASRALAEVNGTLEERVREQTRELRLLADHLERAREEERTRIARELHDELGQELTAMRYTMTLLRQRYDREPASARGVIEQLDALLARITSATRELVSELRPRIIDDLGLDAGVEWLLRRTEERSSLTCRLHIARGEVELDVEISIAAFRILQEALTNVVRHAQATLVDVEVSVDGEQLRLEVRDDGAGMPTPSARRAPQPGQGGMGLIGIRERTEALGGRFHIASEPGSGTTLRAWLPVRRGVAQAAGAPA
ncbi:MAG: sensor histidine kinase [Minicystis sp.]